MSKKTRRTLRPASFAAVPAAVEALESRRFLSSAPLDVALHHHPLRTHSLHAKAHVGAHHHHASQPVMHHHLLEKAQASSGVVEKDQVESQSAYAQFVSWDSTGSIETEVFVQAFDISQRVFPSPSSPTCAWGANVIVFNVATGTSILDAGGILTAPNLTVDSNLRSASLVGTVVLEDVSSVVNYDLNVNITWTATSNPVNSQSSIVTHADGSVTVNDFFGKIRDAVAVGSASIGTTNYISAPSTRGSIQTVTIGTVTTYH